MKQFIKNTELELKNGNHLFFGENPVTNESFVQCQKQAEYIVTFAKMAKGKNFKDIKSYSLEQLKKEVLNALAEKDVQFLEKPKAIEQPLTKQLADEAMSFINFKESEDKVNKINAFMQQFKTLQDFETVGLFFDQGIIKLNKIYTVEEILNAVTETIELL